MAEAVAASVDRLRAMAQGLPPGSGLRAELEAIMHTLQSAQSQQQQQQLDGALDTAMAYVDPQPQQQQQQQYQQQQQLQLQQQQHQQQQQQAAFARPPPQFAAQPPAQLPQRSQPLSIRTAVVEPYPATQHSPTSSSGSSCGDERKIKRYRPPKPIPSLCMACNRPPRLGTKKPWNHKMGCCTACAKKQKRSEAAKQKEALHQVEVDVVPEALEFLDVDAFVQFGGNFDPLAFSLIGDLLEPGIAAQQRFRGGRGVDEHGIQGMQGIEVPTGYGFRGCTGTVVVTSDTGIRGVRGSAFSSEQFEDGGETDTEDDSDDEDFAQEKETARRLFARTFGGALLGYLNHDSRPRKLFCTRFEETTNLGTRKPAPGQYRPTAIKTFRATRRNVLLFMEGSCERKRAPRCNFASVAVLRLQDGRYMFDRAHTQLFF